MTQIINPDTAGPNEAQLKFRKNLKELHTKCHGGDLVLIYSNPTAAYLGRRMNSSTDTVIKLADVCSVLVGRVPGGGSLVGTGRPQMGRALIIEPVAGGELGLVGEVVFPRDVPVAELRSLAPVDQARLLEAYLDLIEGTKKNIESAMGPDPDEDNGDEATDQA